MGSRLWCLCNRNLRQSYSIQIPRPSTSFVLSNGVKRNKGSKAEKDKESLAIEKERASSTADEFRRVAEEKAKDASQTEKANSGDLNHQSVKKRYEEHEASSSDSRRKKD